MIITIAVCDCVVIYCIFVLVVAVILLIMDLSKQTYYTHMPKLMGMSVFIFSTFPINRHLKAIVLT